MVYQCTSAVVRDVLVVGGAEDECRVALDIELAAQLVLDGAVDLGDNRVGRNLLCELVPRRSQSLAMAAPRSV